MLMPSLFTNSFMDDFFDAPSFGVYKYDAPAQNLMSTDVFEKEDGYEIDMNLPGFKKEDVTGEVKDGYLIIKASTKNSKDEKDAKGKYIRRNVMKVPATDPSMWVMRSHRMISRQNSKMVS